MGVAQGREVVDDHDEAGEVGGGHVALSGTGADAIAVTDLGAEAVNGAAGAASVEIGDDAGDVRETRERFERGAVFEIREQRTGEHTSELQSIMRNSHAVYFLTTKLHTTY